MSMYDIGEKPGKGTYQDALGHPPNRSAFGTR
jgi:hypothetical protein